MTQTAKKRLGELLISAGLLDEQRLNEALAEQKKWGGRLGKMIVDLGFVDEATMVLALSRQLGIPSLDLQAVPLPSTVVQFLGVDICERYGVFPVGGDPQAKTLRLAMSDPTSADTLREIGKITGYKIQPVVTTATGIDAAIRRYYYGEVKPPPAAAGYPTPAPGYPTPAPGYPTPAPGYSTPAPGQVPVQAVPQTSFRTLLPTPAPFVPPNAAANTDQAIRELSANVARLEQALTGELRALRCLVEMLVERGVLDHAEYVKRVRGK